MIPPSTTGITRGLASMAVTTRSQAKGHPRGAHARATGLGITTSTPGATGSGDTTMSESKDPEDGNHDDENGSSDPGDSDDEDDSDKNPPTITSDYTGLDYDVSDLSREGCIRIGKALNPSPTLEQDVDTDEEAEPDLHQTSVSYCERFGADTVRFHINDRNFVVIGDAGTAAEVPRCTCGMANAGEGACKHIFWLEDQLLAACNAPKGTALKLDAKGLRVQQATLARILRKTEIALEDVARDRQWALSKPSKADVKNIISVFEPPESPSPSRQNYIRKFKEFENIVIDQAEKDYTLGIKLQSIIDPVFQADAYFDKVYMKASETLAKLDRHVESGATGDDSDADPIQSGAALDSIVQGIDERLESIIEIGGQAMIQPTVNGIGTLIRILDNVARRNRNAYAESAVHTSRQSSPDAENNLYQILIGTSDDSKPQRSDFFIVSVLTKHYRPELLRSHVESLERVSATIQRNGAPSAYLNELNSLSTSRKRSAPDAAGGSSSRTRTTV